MISHSIQELKKSIPPEKMKNDALWVSKVVRYPSFYLSLFFLKINWSANHVSYFSAIWAVLSCILLILPSHVFRIMGALAVNFWIFLDCADGNIARVSQHKSRFGEFADATSGYILMAYVYLAMGITAIFEPKISWIVLQSHWIVLISAFSSVTNLLARLIHHKLLEALHHDEYYSFSGSHTESNSNLVTKATFFVWKNVDVSGFFMPLLLLAVFFQITIFMVLTYALFNFFTASISILLCIRKAQKLDYKDHLLR